MDPKDECIGHERRKEGHIKANICMYMYIYIRTALHDGVVHDGEIHYHAPVPDDAALEPLVFELEVGWCSFF